MIARARAAYQRTPAAPRLLHEAERMGVDALQRLIQQPQKTHMVLISDLYEGGDEEQLLARAAALLRLGVNLIVLLALSDDGRPGFDPQMASAFAALGAPVFACTPDQFPALMACALRREDVLAWAAANDIKAVRAS